MSAEPTVPETIIYPLVGDSPNSPFIAQTDLSLDLSWSLSPSSLPELRIDAGFVPLQASPWQFEQNALFPTQIEVDPALNSPAFLDEGNSVLGNHHETYGLLGSALQVGLGIQSQDVLLNPQSELIASHPTQEIIFIDAGVENAASLMQGINPDAEIVWLSADRDGVEQISEVLAQRHNISAVHVVSHGDAGEVRLGNTVLSQETLGQYAQALQGWSAALTQDADLLFYGCNVASTGDGAAFIKQVASLTGADVAASDDLTGNVLLRGDWDLELATGAIEAETLASQAYEGVLATLQNSTPVIFIPGFGGSFIKDPGDVTSNPSDDPARTNLDDWYVNRGLSPDRMGLEPLGGAYDDIVQSLQNIGYTLYQEGLTYDPSKSYLFVAAWDWRLPVAGVHDGSTDTSLDGSLTGVLDQFNDNTSSTPTFESGVDYLGYWLEKSVSFTGQNKVDIISHSTGGLVARSYIQSDAYGVTLNNGIVLPTVEDLVLSGVPNQGTTETFNFLQDDWNSKTAALALSRLVNKSYDLVTTGSHETINGSDVSFVWNNGTDGNGERLQIFDSKTTSLIVDNASKEIFASYYVRTLNDLLATFNFFDSDASNQPDLQAFIDATTISNLLGDNVHGIKPNDLIFDLNSATDQNAFIDRTDTTTIHYGSEIATKDRVQEQVGPASLSEGGILTDGVQSFTDILGISPEADEIWYQDLVSSSANGDGTVATESAAGQFIGDDDRIASGKLSLINVGASGEQIDHLGLLQNRKAQQAALEAIGVTFTEADDLTTLLSKDLAKSKVDSALVAVQLGILSADDFEDLNFSAALNSQLQSVVTQWDPLILNYISGQINSLVGDQFQDLIGQIPAEVASILPSADFEELINSISINLGIDNINNFAYLDFDIDAFLSRENIFITFNTNTSILNDLIVNYGIDNATLSGNLDLGIGLNGTLRLAFDFNDFINGNYSAIGNDDFYFQFLNPLTLSFNTSIDDLSLSVSSSSLGIIESGIIGIENGNLSAGLTVSIDLNTGEDNRLSLQEIITAFNNNSSLFNIVIPDATYSFDGSVDVTLNNFVYEPNDYIIVEIEGNLSLSSDISLSGSLAQDSNINVVFKNNAVTSSLFNDVIYLVGDFTYEGPSEILINELADWGKSLYIDGSSVTWNQNTIISGDARWKVLGDFELSSLGSIIGNEQDGIIDTLSIDVEGSVIIRGDIGGNLTNNGLQKISITADKGITIEDGANIDLSGVAASKINFIVDAGLDVSLQDVVDNLLYTKESQSARANITVNAATLKADDVTLITNASTQKTTEINIFEEGLLRLLEGVDLAESNITVTGDDEKVIFANDGTTSTITRTDGESWIGDGFTSGQIIKVIGSRLNDDITYTIDSVTVDVITLISTDEVIDEEIKNDSITIKEVFSSILPENLPIDINVDYGQLYENLKESISNLDIDVQELIDNLELKLPNLDFSDLSVASIQNLLTLVPDFFESLISDTESIITIGNGAIISSKNDIIVQSFADSNVSLSTPAMILGGAYVESNATSKVTVKSGARLIAGDDAVLQSFVLNDMSVKVGSLTGGFKKIYVNDKVNQFIGFKTSSAKQVSFAYGKGSSVSETTIENGAVIQTRNADILSKNTNDFDVSSPSKAVNGNPGFALGVAISNTESISRTSINGTIIATGNADLHSESNNRSNSVESTAPLTATIHNLIREKLSIPSTSFDIAGAVGIANSINHAESYIQDHAVIKVDENLNVNSEAIDNFKSLVVAQSERGNSIGIGGAVSMTDYSNTANSIIGAATIDVGKTFNVDSFAQIPNQININEDWAAIKNFEQPLPSLDLSSPELLIDSVDTNLERINLAGDTIFERIVPYANLSLGASNIATTFVGAASATGKSGKFGVSGSVNLLNVNNNATAQIGNGAEVNTNSYFETDQTVNVNAETLIQTINVSGIPNVKYVVLPASKSAGASVGGTYNQVNYDNTTTAFIDDGAEVNAKDINVIAHATNFTVNVLESGTGGGTFGVSGAIAVNNFTNHTYAYIEDQAKVTAKNNILVDANTDIFGLAIGASNGLMSGSAIGVGASVGINEIVNETKAFIGNLNTATGLTDGSIQSGSDLDVQAYSEEKFLTISIAGTRTSTNSTPSAPDTSAAQSIDTGNASNTASSVKSKSGIGISGDVSLTKIDDTTHAYISDIATVTVGNNLSITANNNSFLLSVAGAFTLGSTQSVGGVAIAGAFTENDLDRDVKAFTANTTITSVKDVNIHASTTDKLISVTAGGAGASRKDNASVAGSVNLNFVDSITFAALGDNTNLNSTGIIDIDANNIQRVISVAGGISLVGKVGVGAGVDVGLFENTVQALVGSNASVITTKDIRIKANVDQQVISVGASLSAGSNLGFSGSASSQNFNTTAEAYVGQNAVVTTDRNILIDSNSDVEVIAVGGAATFGKTAGVGAGLSNSNLTHTVKAYIGNDARVSAKGQGAAITEPSQELSGNGILIDATAKDNLYLFGAGGAGAQTAAFAGSAVVNTVNNTVEAFIGQNAIVNGSNSNADIDQSVLLRAENITNVLSVAGSIAGSGTAGVGAAADVEVITKRVKAYIDTQAQVNAANNIIVDAHSQEDILSISAGAVGAGTTAIAGTASVITLNNTTQAYINDEATAIADGSIGIAANNETEIDSIAGNITGSGTASIGASAAVTVVDKTTEAFVGEEAVVEAKAQRDQGITTKTGEFDIGFTNDVGSQTSEVQAPGAQNADLNKDKDGQNDVTNPALTQQRTATARTQTLKGLAITAVNQDDIETIAASGGISGNVAVNLSGGVNLMKSKTSAYIDDNAQINANNSEAGDAQSVLVAAGNDYYHMGISAVGSVAGTIGVTPGADITIVENQTKAFIDDGAIVNAKGDITVVAQAQDDILSVAAGVAASGAVALGGAASVIDVNNNTYAYIGDRDNDGSGATANAGGNIQVAAQNNTETFIIAGSLGVGIGAAGIGGATGVTTIKKDTQAFIGGYSTINAQANAGTSIQGLSIIATSTEDVFNVGASGAGGLYAGLAGGVSIESIDSDTTAFIGNNTQINQNQTNIGDLQSVQVLADNTLNVFAFGGGIAAGAIGIGGGVDVGIDKNNTTAYIGNNAAISAQGNVNVQATSTKDINSYALSGAGGIAAAVGSVSVWSIGTERSSTYSDGNSSANSLNSNGFNSTITNSENQSGEFSELLKGYAQSNSNSVADKIDAAKPSVSGALAAPIVPAGTAAFIGDATTIAAGNNITVEATETIDFNALAGSAAVGAVGIGGSVVVTTIDTNTTAYVGANASLTAGNDITVKAEQTAQVDGDAYAGQAGLTALGAQVVVINNVSDQTAYLGQGVNILQADTVAVRAIADQTLNAYSLGGQVGGLVVGASIAKVSSSGQTQAYVGNQVQIGQSAGLTVDNLFVTARRDTDSEARAIAVSAGIVSGSGALTDSNIDPTVSAFIGNNATINVHQDVSVLALGRVNIQSHAQGANLGARSVGVSSANAIASPTIFSRVGASTTITASRNIIVDAYYNIDESGNPTQDVVKAEASSSAGTLLGGTGSSANARLEVTIAAQTGNYTVLRADRDVSVLSKTNNVIDSSASGQVFGIAAQGITAATAEITNQNSASTGTGTQINSGRNVIISAQSTNRVAQARALGGTGGVFAGASTSGTARITDNTRASVGSNSLINADNGTIKVESLVSNEAHSSGRILTGGLVTSNLTEAHSDVASHTRTEIGNNATLTGQAIQVHSKIIQLDIDADAYSKTFAANSTTNARSFINIDADTQVSNLADANLTSDDLVEIISRLDGVDTDSDATAEIAAGVTGSVYSTTSNNLDMDADIDIQDNSKISGTNVFIEAYSPKDGTIYGRDPDAIAQTIVNEVIQVVTEAVRIVTKAVSWIPFFGKLIEEVITWGTRRVERLVRTITNSNIEENLLGSFNSNNSINIQGDIFQGSPDTARLIVNADGSISSDSNVVATIDGTTVNVSNIIAAPSGTLTINSEQGSISGNVTVHKNSVIGQVELTNNSTYDLRVNQIKTTNNSSTSPGKSINARNNSAIINFVTDVTGAPVINIQGNTMSNIIFAGDISNESGQMVVFNQGGNITTTGQVKLENQSVTLNAVTGNIGTTTDRLNLHLVTSSLANAALSANAGHALYLNTQLEASETNLTTPLNSLDFNNITSSQDIDITLQEATALAFDSAGDVLQTGVDGLYNLKQMSSSSGNITLSFARGTAVNLGQVAATVGTVTLNTIGSIFDANLTGANITAQAAVLQATGTIGTANNALNTQIRNLESSTTNLWLDNAGDLEIGGISNVNGVNARDLVQITSQGNILLTEAITTNTTNGLVTLISFLGSIVDDDDDTNNNIQAAQAILQANGSIGKIGNALDTQLSQIEAAAIQDGVWLDNTGDLEIGGISFLMGITAATIVDISVASSITISEAISTSGGAVLLDGTDDITMNASVTSGGGEVTVLANNNIIFGASGSVDTELGNATVTLTADSDGVAGGGIIMADGSFVNAQSGLIDINATNDIVISLLQTATTITATSSLGAILDTSDVSSQDIYAETVILNANQGVGQGNNALETTIGNLEANAGQGGIWLDNQGGLVIGNVSFSNSGLNASDNIVVSSTGNIKLSEQVTTSQAQVILRALTGSIVDDDDDANNDIQAAQAILEASGSIGEVSNALETQLNQIEAKAITGGVWIDNTGDLEIGGISNLVGITAGTTIDVSAASSITVSEAITTSTGAVLLDATDDITVNAAIMSGTSRTLMAGNDSDDDIIVNAVVDIATGSMLMTAGGNIDINAALTSGGGTITLLAGDDVTFGTSGSINTEVGSATVTVTADADSLAGGGIMMVDGSFINAQAGLIDVNATDDIILSLLQTTTDVVVTSNAGAILDHETETIDQPDILAANAILLAASGIGTSDNPLETDVAKLEADGGTGGIYIDDMNDLVIGTITTQPEGLSTNGLLADSTIRVTTTGAMTVEEDIKSTSAKVILETIDASTSGQDFTLSNGSQVKAATTVELLAGDHIRADVDTTIEAGETITLRSDYQDADGNTGTTIDLLGHLRSTSGFQEYNIKIQGGSDQDIITLQLQELVGNTLVEGGDSHDTIAVDQLPSLDKGDRGLSIRDELTLDGQEGGDTYTINITGGTTDYHINVFDTGMNGQNEPEQDELTIYGTAQADEFLLRASEKNFANGGVAFVAAIHGAINGDPADVERINYNGNVESLVLETLAGDDNVTLDDNWTVTTIRGGTGKDSFQVGQIFQSQRDADSANLADEDEFETKQTSRGFLSNGVSSFTTIEGGDDNDQFTVFRNKAVLELKGDDGDDLFTIRSFATTEESMTSKVDSGEGKDTVEYVANAPVDVQGGSGTDTLRIIGTEFADKFLITENAIFGAGRTITYNDIEIVEIDGAEGQDEFYVFSTAKGVVTKLFGGLGSDYFSLGGDSAAIEAGVPDLANAPITFDFIAENGDILPQLGFHTVNNIKGELIIDGFSAEGSAGRLGDPVMLPNETNILQSTGTIVAFMASDMGKGGTTDSMTVLTEDLEAKVRELNAVVPVLEEISNLIGFTLKITEGNGLHRFWQITDLDQQGTQTVLTLLNTSQPEPEWGLPNASSAYAITALSSNFFVNEDLAQDRVTVFEDGDTTNNTGTLTENQLTGLGLGPNGVVYNNFEQVEILLGQGNDNFTVTNTSDGAITAIHGGGGSDTITALGRGSQDVRGKNGEIILEASLALFGDTTEDGIRYSSTAGVPQSGFANSFTISGNDTIDASAMTESVVIYGGAGNDTVTGSQADDHLAGGSGGDTINGLAGADHIYGDSGFNLDLATRNLTVTTQPTAMTSVDDLIAGSDTIDGGADADIILGDHGVIEQTPGTRRIFTTGNVERIYTNEYTNGTDDTIEGGAGDDRILGGTGSDTITESQGNNIIFGDQGTIDYNAGDNDLTTIDLIQTTDTTNGAGDSITAAGGNDIILGGNSSDAADADTINAGDGRNIILGDFGQLSFSSGNLERIETTDYALGGNDTITTGDGEDIVLGGVGLLDSIITEGGNDIVLGDNGVVDFVITDGDPSDIDLITSTQPTIGGNDTINAGADNDIIIAGTGNDTISGGAGNDLIFGDHGRIEGVIDAGLLPLDQPVHPFSFTSIATQNSDGGGSDNISGNEGDDIIIGGQAGDTLRGNEGDDDLIGGHNIADGHDANDAIDGGAGNDAIAGDNASILRKGNALSSRFRTLSGATIYGETPGVDDGEPLVTDEAQNNPSGASEWVITLFNHSDTESTTTFGSDYIAGGADADTIFGQLGNDTIQGDGSIDETVDAYRNADGTLTVDASFEAATDGDDYIEGNGGADVIFGNLGQDDIVGGSSTLFNLQTASQRPDGSDLIFGGAGTDIARNNLGDESTKGHARDADTIVGDNGNIYRLVGINASDNGAYLTFTYDTYDPNLKLVPRAVELLDYTPGGIDLNPTSTASDIGAGDEIHGESGDDEIYGMVGADILFGEGQDDNLIGGYGSDWISGGTGDDGVIGDDGRIYTSRNGSDETLYGLVATTQEIISTPGNTQQATINVVGELKKTVNLTPFNVDPLQNPLYDAQDADDVIYGGWGNDFLHGSSGDDAISGAEALESGVARLYDSDSNLVSEINLGYATPTNPGNLLGFAALQLEEFAAYDEFAPRRKILINGQEYFLNFSATENAGNDGNDVLFGDLGNDWLVGGTGRDHLYGGWGNDLLNADDNLETNGGLNDSPDTNPSYEDIAFGGAGRDVLIANTGGDRLIDWSGEFNSYLVPFAPFGNFTISRNLQPQLKEYLYVLAAADGADQTRANDTGSNPDRNGEPYGELGLVDQQDAAWQGQTGAPGDPQPGNVPGGARDVLRSASISTTTTSSTTTTDISAINVNNLSSSRNTPGSNATQSGNNLAPGQMKKTIAQDLLAEDPFSLVSANDQLLVQKKGK